MLKWTDDPLTYAWKRHSGCKTHKLLKENLYKDIIENFEKGKMWEMALQVKHDLLKTGANPKTLFTPYDDGK